MSISRKGVGEREREVIHQAASEGAEADDGRSRWGAEGCGGWGASRKLLPGRRVCVSRAAFTLDSHALHPSNPAPLLHASPLPELPLIPT